MTTTICSSRATAGNSALLEIAPARAFVERDRREEVRAHRQLAGLADDVALGVDELGLRQHHELDWARARLARRQIAGDPRSGVVLDRDAMADEIVQLRVVR